MCFLLEKHVSRLLKAAKKILKKTKELEKAIITEKKYSTSSNDDLYDESYDNLREAQLELESALFELGNLI